MVTHDVVVLSYGFKFLHKVGQEGLWVAQVDELASWEGDSEVVPLRKPEHDVQDSAAGCLVRLEEHDISLGTARLVRYRHLLVALRDSAGRQQMGKRASSVPYPISETWQSQI